MMLLWLLACTPEPTPEAVATSSILAGQSAQALQALERIESTSRLSGWSTTGQRIALVAGERLQIHAAEQDMLIAAAEGAIAGGDLSGAIPALRAALELDSPRAHELLERLTAAAEDAEPEVSAAVYGALSEIWEHDRARYTDYAARAAQARLATRYSPDAAAATLSAWEGVTAAAAVHLLERLDREYHTVIDWSEPSRSAQEQLVWLSADPGAQAIWSGLLEHPWQARAAASTLTSHLGLLTDAVAGGAAAGVPAEVVVAEWVDAVSRSLDPWTRAVWPAEIASWEAHHDGVHFGVGLGLEDLDGVVLIDRLLLDTPAWDSGLHQGDQLLSISDDDSEIVLADYPDEQRVALAEAALQGDRGTAVVITAHRPGEDAPRRFSLARGPVKLQTLSGHHREADNRWNRWVSEPDGLAYVRIRAFRDYTEADFDAFTEPLLSELRGLVLDLRGNPGGDVNSAVQIADRFIAEGILAELSGRVEPETGPDIDPVTGQELIPWNHAVAGHALESVPVVVLVDTDTASAAEILAGSLQERAGARIVGAPTWGKGLAQALRAEVEVGYAVQFTNQIWTLPSGRRLDRRTDGGVRPDLVVNLSPAERFQLELSARKRMALRVHADGHPMQWSDTIRRADLPALSDDPVLLWGELMLRAMLEQAAAVN